MTVPPSAVGAGARITILLASEADNRASWLQGQLQMALPRAALSTIDSATLAEGAMPNLDVAVVSAGPVTRGAIETLRLLRGRGFAGPIIVVAAVPDDSALETSIRSLGAIVVSRTAIDRSPAELASALERAASENAMVSAEAAHARRVFAAGQIALSLQHSINNPLAALLAEAQLLQLEELTPEQRGSVDRMVELCRRIVALARRLDALSTTADVT